MPIAPPKHGWCRRNVATLLALPPLLAAGLLAAPVGAEAPVTKELLPQPHRPTALAVDSLGRLYVAGQDNWFARLGPDGTYTLLGQGQAIVASPEPLDATAARWDSLRGMAARADGGVLLAESGQPAILQLSSQDQVSLFAGLVGLQAEGADPTVALGTPLSAFGLAIGPGGMVYLSTPTRIGRIDGLGRLSWVVSGAAPGFSEDGTPAVDGWLDWAVSMVTDRAGNLYIAEMASHRVRKIDGSGVLGTVAGSGPVPVWDPEEGAMRVAEGGYAGDGGPATQARLNSPSSLALDAAGTLFIADQDNGRVRKVDSRGIISTVLEGLGYPVVMSLALDAEGSLYVAVNPRLRPDDSKLWKLPGVAAPGLLAGGLFPSTVLGDVTGEGRVSIEDVVALLRILLGQGSWTPAQRWRADLNGDSQVAIADAVALLRLVAGIGG
ncbi:MAG TPA: dockerin type I domain-containing protein [Armatimonadota bacterium]|jgi:hypothetical protein